MEQFTILPLYVIPAIALIVLAATYSTFRLIPKNWQIINESIYATILGLMQVNLSSKFLYFFPLLFAAWHIIAISNYVGLIPYSTTASTELSLALGLAITLLFGIFIHGITIHGSNIMHLFLPAGTPLGLLPLMIPLEILAYFTRTLSLGLRLAVNLITGHILVKVLLGFVSPSNLLIAGVLLVSLLAFIVLEILISYLQAYIFIFITILTLRDILEFN